MKIQPIDIIVSLDEPVKPEPAKPVLKSRLKRLFGITSSEKLISGEQPPPLPPPPFKDVGGEISITSTDHHQFEPSSVCLAKMVQNFIEDEKPKCGRNRCNCFNGKGSESSDDEFDVFGTSTESSTFNNGGDVTDFLKNLIPCPNIAEKNLLTETVTIVEKNKNIKRKDELRKIVTDHLQSLNYNSSICKSKWDKSHSFPAGEYEYVDVILEDSGDRVLIDVDFRSEFEIARSTSAYKAVLQSVPFIFVGKSDRLSQIVSIISEAAKLSLKKKGLHLPPWRKAEYMRAKWLSPYTRDTVHGGGAVFKSPPESEVGELDLIFGEMKVSSPVDKVETPWKPPPLSPERPRSAKIVTGLSSLLNDKN
ncbi:hypothetical protein ACFE04_006109 [Oxalis oulophora]